MNRSCGLFAALALLIALSATAESRPAPDAPTATAAARPATSDAPAAASSQEAVTAADGARAVEPLPAANAVPDTAAAEPIVDDAPTLPTPAPSAVPAAKPPAQTPPTAPARRRSRRPVAVVASGSLGTMAQVLTALSKEGNGNVVLSPYGFELAGDLLLAGAGSATRLEWLKALGYPATADAVQVASRASKRRETLTRDDSATLSTAAAAWSSMQAPLRAEYIETIRRDHGSHAATVDFGNPATLATINGWFSEQTQGRVPALIDRLSADTQAVLGSALFFQGKWQVSFDPSATRDDAFQSTDGEMQVPTMRHRFDAMSYCSRNGSQAARLPFKGGHYEMTIVLPAAGKELPTQSVSAWLKPDCYAPQAVEFSMPRLSLHSDASLIDALRAAGLSTALGPQPDYKTMSDAGFVPGRILQKTVLKIDEAGAEAAAATAIIGTRSLAIQKPAITMAVNRPYHVILRHLPSDTVLVLALVRKPQGGS